MLSDLLKLAVNNDLVKFTAKLAQYTVKELDAYINEEQETLLIRLIAICRPIVFSSRPAINSYHNYQHYVPFIQALILKGVDINKPIGPQGMYAGNTPLMFAVQRKLSLVTELLLNNGTKINAKNTRGQTCLIFVLEDLYGLSIFTNEPDCLDLILNHPDIDINACDDNGCTALHYAAGNRPEAVKKLLAAKAKIKANNYQQTPLMFFSTRDPISMFGYTFMSQEIIELCLDGNEVAKKEMADAYQQTSHMIKTLIRTGDSVSSQDRYGRNALYFATKASNLHATQILGEYSKAHDYHGQHYYQYFLQIMELVKSNLQQAQDNDKSLIILLGEIHGDLRCNVTEIIFMCVCHSLGITNLLLELDEERAGSSMMDIQQMARYLQMKQHLTDQVSISEDKIYGDNYNLHARNLHMFDYGNKIDAEQLWILGNAHVAEMQELYRANSSKYHVLAVNLGEYNLPMVDVMHLPFPDLLVSICRESYSQEILNCYRSYNLSKQAFNKPRFSLCIKPS